MSKEIYISSTPHETRLAIVENDSLTEIYYERENEYTLAGSIYNGKVTRVLPGMQSSFVDIGLERDAFLYITDFMEEAGDSADFEANGNSEARASRSGASVVEDSAEETGNRDGHDRGGRSRRDRNRGNRDREDRSQRQDAKLLEGSPSDYKSASEDPGNRVPEEDRPFARSQSSDTGETVSTAEGGRRWRGRRGRRRGRGSREGSSEVAGAAQTEEALTHRSYEEEEESDDSGGVDLDAFAQSTSAESSSPSSEQTSGPVSGELRRDRDRRTRNRGGREDRGPRMPRGFAPKTSLYGVEDTAVHSEADDTPAGEPIILPGESLSKYGKPGNEPSPAAQSTVISHAETVILPTHPGYSISSDWDGGSVLPGESLSRHRRSGSTQTNIGSQSKSANSSASPVEDSSVEYEPVNASASHRVDIADQSTFRHSTPVLELDESDAVDSNSALPPTSIVEESFTVPTDHEVWDWQKPVEVPVVSGAVPTHDVTTLQSTGEMTSVAPAIQPSALPASQETSEPAAPIHHETAILSPDTDHVEVGSPVQTVDVGIVEEELVEEDEIQALHASSIEELDDFDEEETLEGAADLGTMIREMSIDQITQTADSDSEGNLDDEDYSDYEEEDSIDDRTSYSLEESEDTDAGSEDELAGSDSAFADPDGFTHEVKEVAGTGDSDSGTIPASSRHERERHRRDSRRRDGRRDNRRDARSRGGAGDYERRGRGRQSMQSTNLPAISELLKPGQEVLVQIAKEPIAKKGARITSHIALPGRFLVFMPTVNHTGVSRKIESDSERRRLKEILLSEKGEASGGFIVRTAAAGATEEELRSDLRFLLNLWTDIKTRSEASKSPALIYHDLNLVERILRDQVTDSFSAIWVDTETDYERILRFLQRFQPSLIRRVKLYTKDTPLFEQFGITEEINKALRSKVWLKSGGSIVINQTEALVAIDINTGKFVGKTARLEDTIVKTNLDAIPEIVRQIRLRDLGGIIIIDFIDMDERKNRNRVMAALEDELKNDRAPSKVLQFNDFGLVAITRKRVKQSIERTLSTTCNICGGTGMVKSPITVCNDIYVEMRKMHRHLDRGDVMLRVHPEVVKALKSGSARWLQEMEEMVGKTILVKSDPALHPEQFDIH